MNATSCTDGPPVICVFCIFDPFSFSRIIAYMYAWDILQVSSGTPWCVRAANSRGLNLESCGYSTFWWRRASR